MYLNNDYHQFGLIVLGRGDPGSILFSIPASLSLNQAFELSVSARVNRAKQLIQMGVNEKYWNSD